ncbi:MAG: isoprenylcysteine carboxylmethyltransferase family protein [Prolixibacteraceae bacterium]|nr:isoprenylcysteine carboxylmethyltransferase family protein [Prolixibacteraceae bacterium]
MKTQNLLKVLAVLGVITGISVFLILSLTVSKNLTDLNLFKLLHFMPKKIIQFVGLMNVLTFLPIFIVGIVTLGTDGAIGKADTLKTWSVYKYVRNPMYSGISFTVFGAGLLMGITGVAAAGLLWLCLCYFVSLIEEKSLTKRFGQSYKDYKKITPRFIPDFKILFSDLFHNSFVNKKGNKKLKKYSYLSKKTYG